MSKSDFFTFKHFRLRNRDSALKINVDGVLLGAWAKVRNTDRVLDIGTGGGVIAFILANRFPMCKILGIDLDAPSIKEADFNVSINDFQNLSFSCISLQQFHSSEKFDHIISNPPFFSGNQSNSAKHDNSLKLSELFSHAKALLAQNAKLSIIIPADLREKVQSLAAHHQLNLSRIMEVRGKIDGPVKRLMLEYKTGVVASIIKEEMYIRGNSKEEYSDRYKQLTKDLYLKF